MEETAREHPLLTLGEEIGQRHLALSLHNSEALGIHPISCVP